MRIQDSVMNEYVHLDFTLPNNSGILAVYEPLDEIPDPRTVCGKVFFENQNPIKFRFGSHGLLFDSDKIYTGYVEEQKLKILWLSWEFEEHFLCVSYEIMGEPRYAFSWLKEGF